MEFAKILNNTEIKLIQESCLWMRGNEVIKRRY